MTDQVKPLDLYAELRIQIKRFLRSIRERALGGFAAGTLLLSYSHTSLPSAEVADALMEKLGNEIAVPDGRFLLVAIASCCVTLVLTGWPPAKPFRRFFAIPYLNFCFDLAGTAIGVFIPAIAAVSNPSQIGAAAVITLVGFLYLFLMAAIVWLGRYFLSERIQKQLQSYPLPYPHALPAGAFIMLLLMYYGKK